MHLSVGLSVCPAWHDGQHGIPTAIPRFAAGHANPQRASLLVPESRSHRGLYFSYCYESKVGFSDWMEACVFVDCSCCCCHHLSISWMVLWFWFLSFLLFLLLSLFLMRDCCAWVLWHQVSSWSADEPTNVCSVQRNRECLGSWGAGSMVAENFANPCLRTSQGWILYQ